MNVKCCKCEKNTPLPLSILIEGVGRVCPDCVAEYYFFCYRCEEDMDRGEHYYGTTAGGDDFCNHCSSFHYMCSGCNKFFLEENTWYVHDIGEYYCTSSSFDIGCLGIYNTLCGNCEEWYHYDGDGCPNECDCETLEHHIKPYSYTPENVFGMHDYSKGKNTKESKKLAKFSTHGIITKGNSKKLFIGVENETENNGKHYHTQDLAEMLMNQFEGEDVIYLKEDGSLNDGFEIVSHPIAFNVWKTGIIDEIFQMTKHGLRSHETRTCGLHLSLSRRAFDRGHLYRFSRFIYFNPHFVGKFSRRKLSRLLMWGNPFYSYLDNENPTDVRSNIEGSNYKKFYFVNCIGNALYSTRSLALNHRNDRGTALNLPRGRVEFRSPRGTLKKETFYANIEFAQSLYEFTQETSAENLKPFLFKKWVDKSNRFRNLSTWLDKSINYREWVLLDLMYTNNTLNETEARRGKALTQFRDYTPLNKMLGVV
jgi:hypothetical protein